MEKLKPGDLVHGRHPTKMRQQDSDRQLGAVFRTWIRIDLALLDPDPDLYWECECGSGSMSNDIDIL